MADYVHLHGGMESPNLIIEVTTQPAHSHRHIERVFAAGQAEPCLLGSSDGSAIEVFQQVGGQHNTSINPQHLAEMAAGTRRSLELLAPIQMVPEIVRALGVSNVAIHKALHWED